MSTIKTINAIHPSGSITNIVMDASGNVAVGGTSLTVAGTAAIAVAPGTSGNVLTSTGTAWASTTPSSAKAANVQTFLSSGTWTKPTGYGANSQVHIQCWGGGGSGNKVSSAGVGGGGGGYNDRWISLSSLGSTETATVGAGGIAVSTSTGNTGGTTSLGTWCSAFGGGPGTTSDSPGGGGGQLSAGIAFLSGNPQVAANGSQNQGYGGSSFGVDAFILGGGGGDPSSPGFKSVWGGGGGGGYAAGAGGVSSFGGNGGAGVSASSGIAGTQPGGGGGGTSTGTVSGAGAAGQIIITVFGGA